MTKRIPSSVPEAGGWLIQLLEVGGEPRLRDWLADNNLYFCHADPAWGRGHLEQEQPFGVETHSLAADPKLVNFENGDLRLKPGSPDGKTGFEAIDISHFGLRPEHPYHRR